MGKIRKLRQQKKLEEELALEQKNQRNKKIITGVIIGVLAMGFLIYGATKLWGTKNQSNTALENPRNTPAATPAPASLFPFLAPSFSPLPDLKNKVAVIETAKGSIKLELFASDAPKTAANFVALINQGFYNGLTFHRVVPGFVIQGGDPKGDGTGGPGYTFEDEINPWSLELSEDVIKSYEAQGYKYIHDLISHKITVGALAMANAGPNTNGSQFFIVTEEDQPSLDGKYTVFGRVIEGMEVVRKIQQGDIIKEIKIEK